MDPTRAVDGSGKTVPAPDAAGNAPGAAKGWKFTVKR